MSLFVLHRLLRPLSGPTTSLSSDAPRVRASFVEDIEPRTGETIGVEEEGHELLVIRVQLAPSREWANAFFDLLNNLIGATGLPEDDLRLVTSIAQDYRIGISINRRYVLGAFFSGKPKTGFITGEEAENVAADGYYGYSANTGEDEEKTPYWFEYEGKPKRMVSPTFHRGWIKASIREIERGSGSLHQDSHEPFVYQATVDESYRNQVLNKAILVVE